jgi:hypothetical protein
MERVRHRERDTQRGRKINSERERERETRRERDTQRGRVIDSERE